MILRQLGENLIKASSGREALEYLLKTEIAVVLVDVCMPDLDGFQLAAMIREHPRFKKTAMIFISAIHLSDMDRLRGYEMGAVDYVPVPVIPEVLRAKVKVFAELYRKTRELEKLNAELEQRVAARTAELQASTGRLLQSEQRRSLALAAGNMGAWDWDRVNGDCLWDDGQCRIFGVERESFAVTPENMRVLLHPDDWNHLQAATNKLLENRQAYQGEFRVRRPNGEVRWCFGSAAPTVDEAGNVVRISGVTVDITDRKEAEERQALLSREVDHRAKNALALVQSIIRLTRAGSVAAYTAAVEGRIQALSRAHTVLAQSRWQGADLGGLVEEEVAPFRTGEISQISLQGPRVLLQPTPAQTLALALHELATNAAKYGALSRGTGTVKLSWEVDAGTLVISWSEAGGPPASKPASQGFGTRLILASVEGQLGGKALFDWRPEGLKCILSRAAERQARASRRRRVWPSQSYPARRTARGRRRNAGRPGDDRRRRAAGGDGNERADGRIGHDRDRPVRQVGQAIAALKDNSVNAALLDINLAGELVYPLADRLMANNVPFVFVTGYGSESIDRRYANVRVLQKPIKRDVLADHVFATPVTADASDRRRAAG